MHRHNSNFDGFTAREISTAFILMLAFVCYVTRACYFIHVLFPPPPPPFIVITIGYNWLLVLVSFTAGNSCRLGTGCGIGTPGRGVFHGERSVLMPRKFVSFEKQSTFSFFRCSLDHLVILALDVQYCSIVC